MGAARYRILAATVLLVSACSVEGLSDRPEIGEDASPAVSHPRFGLGQPAPAELIAAWDIDVRPDGTGLPAGSATVADGRTLFAARCAACHGADGTGGINDALVGEPVEDFPFGRSREFRGQRAVGNYWPYATTLFDYVRRAMPYDAPGSLTDDQVYAAVAYVLFLNGIVDEDTVMDAETLAGVVMPAADRFVPDDRTGGPTVR